MEKIGTNKGCYTKFDTDPFPDDYELLQKSEGFNNELLRHIADCKLVAVGPVIEDVLKIIVDTNSFKKIISSSSVILDGKFASKINSETGDIQFEIPITTGIPKVRLNGECVSFGDFSDDYLERLLAEVRKIGIFEITESANRALLGQAFDLEIQTTRNSMIIDSNENHIKQKNSSV